MKGFYLPEASELLESNSSDNVTPIQPNETEKTAVTSTQNQPTEATSQVETTTKAVENLTIKEEELIPKDEAPVSTEVIEVEKKDRLNLKEKPVKVFIVYYSTYGHIYQVSFVLLPSL